MARPRNLLFVMSDQHQPRGAGFAGSAARMPHLDGLAARGTTYARAYCTSPICVPARASIATGRYVHDLGTWDNAAPYHGTPASWGHALADAGYRVTTIGKLHHRGSDDDDGFPDQRLAMHVHGLGDLKGVSLRPENAIPPRKESGLNPNLLTAGVGESDYTRFDRAVANEAVRFLTDEVDDEPWALMVSFVAPHFPLIAPAEHHARYDPASFPPAPPASPAWDHPTVEVFKEAFGLTRPLTDDEHRRSLHAYLALCAFLDDRIGDVLGALATQGLTDDTLVVYTSDHGEAAGEHGLWLKHLLHEASVGVPLLVAGPGVEAGRVVDAPASHVDLFPTFLAWAGIGTDDDLPGRSLLAPDAWVPHGRSVMAEYHANGTTAASFMLRHDRFKYLHHVGRRPQLFDLVADPGETIDLADDPGHAAVLADCERRLRLICDPEHVDALAKADQAARVAAVGGVDAAEAHTVPYTPVPGSR